MPDCSSFTCWSGSRIRIRKSPPTTRQMEDEHLWVSLSKQPPMGILKRDIGEPMRPGP